MSSVLVGSYIQGEVLPLVCNILDGLQKIDQIERIVTFQYCGIYDLATLSRASKLKRQLLIYRYI